MWYESVSPNPVFAENAAGGAPGFVVPRAHETTAPVRSAHLRCVQGVTFGRFLATR